MPSAITAPIKDVSARRHHRAWRLATLAALAGLLCLAACGDGLEYGEADEAVTGNVGDNGAVRSEQMHPDVGRYRAVMQADTCTGTVLGPHAVLTAYHCAKALAADIRYDAACNNVGAGGKKYIRWHGNPAQAADDTRMEVTNNFGNPHAINRKYFLSRRLPVPPHAQGKGCEYRPYAPLWWGANTTLPHPHDVAVFFVPGLTQRFIDDNNIEVGRIDGLALERARVGNRLPGGLPGINPAWFNFELVGRMGGGNKTRRFGAVRFASPDPSDPGQLPFLTNLAGFVHTNPGDSGGPTYGYINRLLSRTRLVVATTKSGRRLGSPSTPASGTLNTVPVAYLAGMSGQQRESVRLNHLWLKARRDDADNDGYPIQCDANPAAPGLHRTARCPAPDGRPTRSRTKGYPQGSLMCRDGYVATGYRGKYGSWGVRTMALRCSTTACVSNAQSSSCSRTYWTDTYGLRNSGTSYSQICAPGEGMYGFFGRIRRSNGRIQSFGINCMRPGRAYRAHPERGRQSAVGAYRFHHQCSGGRYLQGAVVRMVGRSYLSGVQAVCAQ